MNLAQFEKSEWLLDKNEATKVVGGKPGTICYTCCSYDECGDWSCEDEDPD